MSQCITPFEINPADIEIINKYTRKKLNPNEIYTFSIILCDNDVDREFESFTKESLIKMANMFQGVTGIFDHDMSSKNQISRIYKATVISSNEKTIYGETKYKLKAFAYMPKNDSTKNIISKIDSGILKEVSVSCSIQKKTCSICGKIYDGTCGHDLGKIYNGKYCYIKLENPTDAFEWSFVAVPAQRCAGVIKNFVHSDTNNEINKQNKMSIYYENRLKAQVIKLGFLNNFMKDNDATFKNLINKLSLEELEAFKEEFEKNLDSKSLSPTAQTYSNEKNINYDFIV